MLNIIHIVKTVGVQLLIMVANFQLFSVPRSFEKPENNEKCTSKLTAVQSVVVTSLINFHISEKSDF